MQFRRFVPFDGRAAAEHPYIAIDALIGRALSGADLINDIGDFLSLFNGTSDLHTKGLYAHPAFIISFFTSDLPPEDFDISEAGWLISPVDVFFDAGRLRTVNEQVNAASITAAMSIGRSTQVGYMDTISRVVQRGIPGIEALGFTHGNMVIFSRGGATYEIDAADIAPETFSEMHPEETVFEDYAEPELEVEIGMSDDGEPNVIYLDPPRPRRYYHVEQPVQGDDPAPVQDPEQFMSDDLSNDFTESDVERGWNEIQEQYMSLGQSYRG